jgi:hypothetical protein
MEPGMALATFIHSHTMGLGKEFTGNGWIYPGCVAYEPATILSFIREAGMIGVLLPWFHPRQHWYAMALKREALPSLAKFAHLSGGTMGFPQSF